MVLDIIQISLIFIAGGSFLLLIFLIWIWFIPDRWKGKEPEEKPRELEPPKDWHKGKHFGTVFWNPELRCNCVVLKVIDRDDWYFASEKQPDVYQKSKIPVNRIAGELK